MRNPQRKCHTMMNEGGGGLPYIADEEEGHLLQQVKSKGLYMVPSQKRRRRVTVESQQTLTKECQQTLTKEDTDLNMLGMSMEDRIARIARQL